MGFSELCLIYLMPKKYEYFHDFCQLFRLVHVSWTLKQWNKHILNPIVIDLSKLLKNPEGI